MSNGSDPIDEYFSQMQQQEGAAPGPSDPIDAYFQQMQQGGGQEGPGLLGQVGNWIQNADEIARMLTTAEGVKAVIGAARGDEHALAELGKVAPFAAGVAGSGVLETAAGITGLPGALLGTEDLPTDKLANWFKRQSAGLQNDAEKLAMQAGLSEEDIANSYSMGNFVGFGIPIAASMKLASMMLRTGQSVGQAAKHGEYLTDFTAGLIFGGLMQPGDAERRVKGMLEESAAFGVMRTALMLPKPLKVLRHKMAGDAAVDDRINLKMAAAEDGKPIFIENDADLEGVLSVIGKENYIAHSLGAQEILQKQEYDAAVVQAVLDVQGTRGTAGTVRGIGTEWQDVSARMDRMKEQFPGLKFSVVSREIEEGKKAYDLYFGPEGLNNTQKKIFAKEGVFPNQVMQYGDSEVRFVRSAKREGWATVIGERQGKPHVFEVKRENLTELPVVDNTPERMPKFDTLHQDFRSFVEQNMREVVRSRGGLLESDLIEMARQGNLPELGPEARRAFEGNALVYPEELGLTTSEDIIRGIAFEPSHEGAFVHSIEHNTRRGAKSEFNAMVRQPGMPGGWMHAGEEGPWRLTTYETQSMTPAGHETFMNLDDALARAEENGLVVADVTRKVPTQAEASQLLSQSGTEYANILEPLPTWTLDDAWDAWAKAKNLDVDATDALSAKTYMTRRLRRDLWSSVDDETNVALKGIFDEYDELTASQDFSVNQVAATRGFHAEKLDNGGYQLRQIDSGLTLRFGSERMARKALQHINDPAKDIPSLISGGRHALTDWSRGLPKSNSFTFEDMVYDVEDFRGVHRKALQNNRDWLVDLEETTGIPVWSKGFDRIQEGYTKLLSDYEPWARSIREAWKGINIKRRNAISEFWVEAEQAGMSMADAAKAMKARGFNSREIQALRRSRAMFDEWFEMSGIDRSRYIEMYYTRVRPFAERNNHVDIGKMFGGDLKPSEAQFWAEYTRTGDLAVMELDPELVMHKYIRTLMFQKHVKESWDDLARMVGTQGEGGHRAMTFGDLPPDVRRDMMKNNPGVRMHDPVIPDAARSLISEYLMTIRGQTQHATQQTRAWTKAMFHRLKIDADERTVEELVNSWMSMQYGAAMGLRPSVVARNLSQTIWMLYTRIGGKHMGRALEMAHTREGFEEARRAGAIRMTEAGVPMGEKIQEHIMTRSPQAMEGAGLMARAVAGGLRWGMRTGNFGRALSRKALVYYSSSDMSSRSWAYHAQKLHTDDILQRFESGKLEWDKFEEKGLPFFARPVIDKFTDIYNRLGREEALQFIGRAGADESNFIYGMAAQPAWMQSMPGRLVGMFGTWPLWAIETYARRQRHATLGQSAALTARTLALTGAFMNMGLQTGIDMWSWIAPMSMFGWGGGPAVEHGVNAKRFIEAPMDQKAGAFKRMAGDMARLIVPGQVFYNDAMRAATISDHNPTLGALSMLLGRPDDMDHIGLNYLYNPDSAPDHVRWISPENREWIDGRDATWYNTLDFREGAAPESVTTSTEDVDMDRFNDMVRMLGGQ